MFSCMRRTHVFMHAHNPCFACAQPLLFSRMHTAMLRSHVHMPMAGLSCVSHAPCVSCVRFIATRPAPGPVRHPGGSGPGSTGFRAEVGRLDIATRPAPTPGRLRARFRLSGSGPILWTIPFRAGSPARNRAPLERQVGPGRRYLQLLMHGPKKLYKLQKCLLESLNSSSPRTAGRTRPAPTPASSSFQVGGECLLAFSFPAKKRRRISPSLFASSDFASSSFQVGRPRKPRKPPENGRKPETVGNGQKIPAHLRSAVQVGRPKNRENNRKMV